MRIYVAGALLGASDLEEACARYWELGNNLRERGFDIYLPQEHTHPNGTKELRAREVFDRGVRELKKSTVLLALLDEPSLGTGAEIALALEEGMTVIGAHRFGTPVSRFVVGLLESVPNTQMIVYETLPELAARVQEVLAKRS
jgi:hypothetical protein